MKNPARIAAALVLSIALSAAIPSAASAVLVHGPGGKRFGLIPHHGISARALPGSVAAQQTASAPRTDNGTLAYNGGPVVHSSAPYLIFWAPNGETIPSTTQSLLQTYLRDTAADSGKANNVFGVSRQYTDATGFANYQQSFDPQSQVIVDTAPYPPQDTSTCPDTTSQYPTCITDAQLEQEIQQVIAAKGLPTDGSNTTQLPQSAPIYFVVLPSDVNVCASATECADNVFCAYHSNFTDGNNNVLYAAIPTLLAALDPKGCQFDNNNAVQEPNGDMGDVVIGYMSHEYNETITDPFGTAWWDTSSGNEDGDNCVFWGSSAAPSKGESPDAFQPTLGGSAGSGTLYDQQINGDNYYTQSEWSNGDTACEMRPSSGTVTPSFTAPSGPNAVGTPLTFDPSASMSTHQISSQTWDFGDRASSFKVGATSMVSHTYSAAGTYTVTLTLVDNRGNLQSTSQQISVYSRPNASFTSAPSSPLEGTAVNFDASGSSDPDPGVTISSYAWNFGDGAMATGATSSHSYPAPGTYTVTLMVTNSVGLTGTSTHQIRVIDEPPIASVIVATTNPAAKVPVQFDGASSFDPDGSITSYAVNFGDGSTGSGTSPRHTYARAGTYLVRLTVGDRSGESASTSIWVVVAPGSQIAKTSTKGTGESKTLAITINGAGTLRVGSRRFNFTRAKTVKVHFSPSRSQRARLRRTHRLTIVVAIRFVPRIGAPTARRVRITFTV